jgi:hypothetical protein
METLAGPPFVQQWQRLQLRNLEWLATADVRASKFVIAPYQGNRAMVNRARSAWSFAVAPSYHQGRPIFFRLSAPEPSQSVRSLFRGFIERSPLFHDLSASYLFSFDSIRSILVLAAMKRKPTIFSATKAVNANARERVGQSKSGRVPPTRLRSGRRRGSVDRT